MGNFLKNIFKKFVRANSGLYGDVYGSICGEQGKGNVTVEDGKVVVWNKNDYIVEKADVASFEYDKSDSNVKHMLSGGGKSYEVDIYNIALTDGKTGYLRIIKNVSWKDNNGQIRTKDFSDKAKQLIDKLS